MTQKIIRQQGRIILIKNELDKEETWMELFDSLTLAEGMAMGNAMNTWMEKNHFIKTIK